MISKELIEKVAKEYHEICREMVEKQIGMITKLTRPYIEWKDLTEYQKDGRRFISKNIIEKMRQFNLCDICSEFGKGNCPPYKPVFMGDVSPLCPNPQNTAIIDCIKFKLEK